SLRLSETVVTRQVPMTEKGSAMLRSARDHLVEVMEAKSGIRYDIPFPVVIHMVLEDYNRRKGLDYGNGNGKNSH
ncbi:MAG: DUF7195 family protein, partial [Cetobacterium sp.]|uniref:DUF7195 family protein n=1 Tax=Cetobacterium sp. TaxID=2071632 RepID=UPI003EE55CEC